MQTTVFQGDYISLDLIKENLLRLPVFNIEWNDEEINEWTYRALRKIGVKKQNVYKSDYFILENNRLKLPKHIQSIEEVIDKDTNITFTETTNGIIHRFEYFRNLDMLIFHQNQTSDVLLRYTILPLDDNDNPLVPDNEYYLSAIEAYIRFQLGMKAYYQKKIISNELLKLEQEWNFYILATQNNAKMPSNYAALKRIRNRY